MKRASFFAIVAVAACQQADSKPAQRAQQLPANPHRGLVDEDCSGFVIEHPKSAGGQLVARNGWIVTSETKLGSYDTVTFVGALKRAWILATCAHVNGNLAVFDGSRLKAIAYELRQPRPAAPSEGVEAEDTFSFAEQIDGRRIRLSYGLPSPPFADMVLRDGIFIEPIRAKDPVCGGAAYVPNVFGEDIRKARKKLFAYGWRPSRSTDKSDGAFADELRGVVEIESCSGVGYGFCGFNYRHKKGFGLGVSTTGDNYPVISYGADCSGGKKANPRGKG